MLAGMGGVSYHRLVAAVSEAGGIGTLGASTMRPGELATEMAAVRAATAKPFGVDLLTALPGQVEAGLDDVIAGGARLFVAGLGVPRDVVDALHDAGVVVGSMCGKVRHAISAVASGCDFVVAQGTEAGGHTGTVATMALVPQVVDAVADRVPVVAAGGLFDGRGLAAVAVPRGRRRVGRHPVHRHARSARRQRLQGHAGRHRRGRHGGVAGLHRQTVPRGAQRVDPTLRGPPRRARSVPAAGGRVGARRRQPPRAPRRDRRRPDPRVLSRRPRRRRDRLAAYRRASWCSRIVDEAEATLARVDGVRGLVAR